MTARAMLSATQAAGALERLVASAENEVLLCLPGLSPVAPLVTPDLRERGMDTWADLLAWLSRRGPDLRILIADADPLLAPDRHRAAWTRASGIADVLQGDAQLICAAHGQRATGLRAWPLRRRLAPALAALRAGDPARLTPVQRALLTSGPVPRPADISQSFAVADGQRAVIGGPDLGTDADSAFALAVEDSDFCGALRGHFADSWADACTSGGASLAARTPPVDCPTRPQSRDDLRLLRTWSRPQRGLGPRTIADDIEIALTRLFATAKRRVLIRTAAFRHDGLGQALIKAATHGPKLTLLLPPRTAGTWDDARANALQATRLRQLRDAFGDRLTTGTDAAAATGATLCVIDDVTVLGSAALTRRACRWNSETAVLARDAALADLFAETLGAGLPDGAADGPTPDTAAAKPGLSLLPDDLF